MLPELESERLWLRPRQLSDLDAIADLNADPQVMRHITAVGAAAMGREAVAARSFSHVAQGLGYWSIFPKEAPAEFIGYVGLIPHSDGLEVPQLSYRFAVRHWGKGYAREATACLLDHGFDTLGFAVVGIATHPKNTASLKLAQRLGFAAAPDDPPVLIGEPAVPAALLRLTREAWKGLRPPAA